MSLPMGPELSSATAVCGRPVGGRMRVFMCGQAMNGGNMGVVKALNGRMRYYGPAHFAWQIRGGAELCVKRRRHLFYMMKRLEIVSTLLRK